MFPENSFNQWRILNNCCRLFGCRTQVSLLQRGMATKKAKLKKKQGGGGKKIDTNIGAGIVDMRSCKDDMEQQLDKFKDEFGRKFSTRISAGVLDEVPVTIGGRKQKLFELAQTTSDNKEFTIRIMTKEQNAHLNIMKAIQDSGLNVNPRLDGADVKVPIPIATTEYRESLAKLAKASSEESKVSIRRVRQQELIQLRKQKNDISKDEMRTIEKQLQQLTDAYVDQVEGLYSNKEKELKAGR